MDHNFDIEQRRAEELIEFAPEVIVDSLDDVPLRDRFDIEVELYDTSNPSIIPHHELVHIVGSPFNV